MPCGGVAEGCGGAQGCTSTAVAPSRSRGRRNWVETVPGKGFNFSLRLYGPLETCFDKTGARENAK